MVSIPYKTQGDAVAVTVIEIKYKKQQFTLDVFCVENKDVFMFHTFTVDLSKYHQCVHKHSKERQYKLFVYSVHIGQCKHTVIQSNGKSARNIIKDLFRRTRERKNYEHYEFNNIAHMLFDCSTFLLVHAMNWYHTNKQTKKEFVIDRIREKNAIGIRKLFDA